MSATFDPKMLLNIILNLRCGVNDIVVEILNAFLKKKRGGKFVINVCSLLIFFDSHYF